MNDGFTPVIRNSIAANMRTLEQNEAERRTLEQALYQLRKKGQIPPNKRKKASELKQRLTLLGQEQDSILPEAKRQLEELKQGRRPFVVEDEVEQPFNECIGYAYGVAIFVHDSGALLYCEVQEGTVEIGDTLPADELHPFEDLPAGEQDMILRELAGRDETPDRFKNRNETA